MSEAPIEPREPQPACKYCSGALLQSDVQTFREELAWLTGSTDKLTRFLGLRFIATGIHELIASDIAMHAEMDSTVVALEEIADALDLALGIMSVLLGESNNVPVALKRAEFRPSTMPDGTPDEELTICANCAYTG